MSQNHPALTLFLGLGSALAFLFFPQLVSAAETEPITPDLSEPLPKELALDLFRQLFALAAEDSIQFEEAAEAGRISPEVRAFHEHLLTFNQQTDFDPAEMELDELPFVDLPDGSRVYPMLLETLSPHIRENLTQADLNALLPEIADLQRRISDYEKEQAGTPDFHPVRLKTEDLVITLAKYEPEDGTLEIVTSPEPDAPSLHFHLPAFLDGRHVMGARISQQPFTSIHLQLTEEGGRILSEATETHAGNLFGILLDGKFHAAVAVAGRMETRQLQLPRRMSEEEATALLESWIVSESVGETENPAGF